MTPTAEPRVIMPVSENMLVYFYTEHVNMRKLIDALCLLVSEVFPISTADG